MHYQGSMKKGIQIQEHTQPPQATVENTSADEWGMWVQCIGWDKTNKKDRFPTQSSFTKIWRASGYSKKCLRPVWGNYLNAA